MSDKAGQIGDSWVDGDACTLPTAEQPLRVAEFDALFAKALREVERLSPTRLRLTLAGSAEIDATARDLIARETSCCSFFSFSLTHIELGLEDLLRLEIQVPSPQARVLDALADRARQVSGLDGAAA